MAGDYIDDLINIDLYPHQIVMYANNLYGDIEDQIEGWASEYMSPWPELLAMQLESYSKDNVDWKQIAREKVFPFLGDRLPAMRQAHENLLQLCPPTYLKAKEALGSDTDVAFVIYVGIGCGAGWAATFQGKPAVLLGLENIAECGWTDASSTAALVAHELGHLAHEHWRRQAGLEEGSGPFWQLYSEGFAQRAEHTIMGKDTWHESAGINDPDWLDWCRAHQGWLAAEFLRRVDAGESVRPFFGHWFDIQGRRQCGYFLGHELVKQLAQHSNLKEIALLPQVDQRIRTSLEQIADR